MISYAHIRLETASQGRNDIGPWGLTRCALCRGSPWSTKEDKKARVTEETMSKHKQWHFPRVQARQVYEFHGNMYSVCSTTVPGFHAPHMHLLHLASEAPITIAS